MEGKRVQGGVGAVKALHSDLAGPMSEKLCDLFGRLVCVSVCMHVCLCALLLLLLLFIHPRCAFYYGKIVVFIILLVRTRVELAWSEARLRPGEVAGCCKHNCNAYP